MLLGIPGDNTFANYQEANRALWRQTILPLLDKTADALNGWLTPKFGDGLRLAYDLDAIPALSAEREALWSRIEAASFLTLNEKRRTAGLGPVEGGDSRFPVLISARRPPMTKILVAFFRSVVLGRDRRHSRAVRAPYSERALSASGQCRRGDRLRDRLHPQGNRIIRRGVVMAALLSLGPTFLKLAGAGLLSVLAGLLFRAVYRAGVNRARRRIAETGNEHARQAAILDEHVHAVSDAELHRLYDDSVD